MTEADPVLFSGEEVVKGQLNKLDERIGLNQGGDSA